ncbi:hypothetical protein [Galactobacillus timonensis]|uniref:hypothetical protein n=1 Tax=Galactobacillus timonensis TaxID=2041840 RepID=UPI0024094D9D|nr:hypothetical protein [Galactobacillus timonensis]MDD6681221.1 hypothetical protein [Galactobacillus timonensis]
MADESEQTCIAEASRNHILAVSLSVQYAEEEDPQEYILCDNSGYFWLIDQTGEDLIRLHMPYLRDELRDSLEDLDLEEDRIDCLAAALHLVINNEWNVEYRTIAPTRKPKHPPETEKQRLPF